MIIFIQKHQASLKKNKFLYFFRSSVVPARLQQQRGDGISGVLSFHLKPVYLYLYGGSHNLPKSKMIKLNHDLFKVFKKDVF